MTVWNVKDLKDGETNFVSPASAILTIKSIRKLTQAEREEVNPEWVGNHVLWPYWVEFKENNVVWSNTTVNRIRVHRNNYSSVNGNRNNNNDVFYYFMFYLNRDVQMCFRAKWAHNNKGATYQVFGLSGAWNQSIIIAVEKSRWDALGYTEPEDLIQENKQYVDKGIRKEHRNRPSYEELQTQLEQAKKDKEKNEAPSFEDFGEEPQTEAKILQTNLPTFTK